jgi:DNA-binding response OmpR family regulator
MALSLRGLSIVEQNAWADNDPHWAPHMTPTIAIAEDEEALREAVAEYLGGRGMRVLCAANAAELRALAASEPIDVAVLDIAMPGESGLALARWLKSRGARLGIIFGTAAGARGARIAGLELGADDYIVKPYELRELYARINSVLRRLPEGAAEAPVESPPAKSKAPPIRIGGFLLDLDSRRLVGDDRAPVMLSQNELELLLVLAERPNRLLTRGQLLELAQARDADVNARAIDVRIARLRAKLEPVPDKPRFIRTIRGEGYMFVPDGP